MQPLIRDLQRVAPRAVDLDGVRLEPRVAVRADDEHNAYDLAAADRLVAILWNLAPSSRVMRGGWSPATSDLLLRLRVNDRRNDGRDISVRGVLVLVDRKGGVRAKETFLVNDLLDHEAATGDLLQAFRAIEVAVADAGEAAAPDADQR